MGVLSEECYNWLQTFPLSREDIQKIIFFSLFRGIRWVFLTGLIVLPLSVAIFTKSVLLTILALGISSLNIFFSFAALVGVGIRLKKMFEFKGQESKAQTFVRIGMFVGYMVLIMAIVLGIQFLIPRIGEILNSSPAFATEFLNQYLPVIPFPFSGAYLLSALSLEYSIPQTMIGTLTVGLILYVYFAYKLFNNTKKKLFQVMSGKETDDTPVHKTTIDEIEVDVVSSTDAYVRKNKNMAKRDMQLVIFNIIPFVYAVMSIFMGENDESIFMMVALYVLISGNLLVVGMLNANNTGASIQASLPSDPRHQVKAIMKWISVVLLAAYLFTNVFLLDRDIKFLGKKVLFDLYFIALGIVVSLLMLELKVYFFGKLNYKYVLEEVSIEKKVMKWIGIFVVNMIIIVAVMVSVTVLLMEGGASMFFSIMVPVLIGLGALAYYIFNKMFPKIEESKLV